MVPDELVPTEGVLLRPTRPQRVVGALTRSACAAPLLLGALLGGGMVATALLAAVIAGLVVFVLDLLVRADQAVELRVDCLVAKGRTYPWWSIDRLDVRHRAGRDEVVLAAFGMDEFALDAPRSGIIARHKRFGDESALLVRAWERFRTESVAPGARRDTQVGDRMIRADDGG